MSQTNVTIKDVAKVAGVSPATVSLVLSGDPRVKEATREIVEEAARRLNYIPNEIGRSLRSRKTETIGLIVPNTSHHVFSHPYFSKLLEGVSETLNSHNYNLLLSTTGSEKDEAVAYDRILRNRRVDGIIVTSASIKDRNILRIIESGFPVIYLGRWHHDNVLTVERDDFGGAYAATEHLISLGRKKIVHISGPLDHQESIDRLEGYKRALQENRILFDDKLVVEEDFSKEAGYEAALKLLQNTIGFDAVFAGNDLMAIGAIKCFHDHKIAVPEDISIVGFDDIEMGEIISPALTTIHQPMKKIGNIAAEKLIAVLNNQELEEKRSIVTTSLVIRESCGAKKK